MNVSVASVCIITQLESRRLTSQNSGAVEYKVTLNSQINSRVITFLRGEVWWLKLPLDAWNLFMRTFSNKNHNSVSVHICIFRDSEEEDDTHNVSLNITTYYIWVNCRVGKFWQLKILNIILKIWYWSPDSLVIWFFVFP